MEYGVSESFTEQSQMGTTIKTEAEAVVTCTASIDIQTNLNPLKQEPGLIESVESEPAMLVKKEIVENSSEDVSASTPADTGSFYEADCASQSDWINVKPELEEMDIEPTVLQHMDIHYALNKRTVDGCDKEMQYNRVKKEMEDKLRGSLTPQLAMAKEQILDLVSVCTVHVMRLDVFQCDICYAVYTEKDNLLQHLQAVHAYRPHTSLIVKFRKTNKQTAADNNGKSHNCNQNRTEEDYVEAHVGHHLRQQKYLQMHLHQNCTISSNDFKCDSIIHKQHLLSIHNKLYLRNSGKTVATRGSNASPSDQSEDKTTKTKLKPFECNICENEYFSKAGLNSHKRSHSIVELKNHSVNYESHKKVKHYHYRAKFTQSDDLTKNMGVHTGEKPYQCKICCARFAQNNNLTRHMRVHTGEKPYQCKICDASFAQSNGLTCHGRVHRDKKPYQCKICYARFTESDDLTKHMRIHTGEKPYLCKICGARFARSSGLSKHFRVHTGQKPYQCKICDAKFSHRTTLTLQVRVHTGEKPYQCKICDASFAGKGNLTKHLRVHTGEKPFHCKICDARFAQSNHLTRHMSGHTSKKPYQCKICNVRFAQSYYLTQHIRIHTSEKPYQCKICDAKFGHNGNLSRHKRVHMVEKRQ